MKEMGQNRIDENAPDRGVYAVQEALSIPFGNSAVVMGTGHKNPIKRYIKGVPFEKRPTFFFVEPECQANPEFYVSPAIIDQAFRQLGKKP